MMKKNFILMLILIVGIFIGGCLQKNLISNDFSYSIEQNDFSYSIEKYDKGIFFNVAPASSCINFEANFYSGACNKYKYQYVKDNTNLKIILTDLDECMWHLTSYGIKGKICNLEKEEYNIILGVDSGGDSIKEVFKESIEIK